MYSCPGECPQSVSCWVYETWMSALATEAHRRCFAVEKGPLRVSTHPSSNPKGFTL